MWSSNAVRSAPHAFARFRRFAPDSLRHVGNRRYVRRNVSRQNELSLGAGNEARLDRGHADPSSGCKDTRLRTIVAECRASLQSELISLERRGSRSRTSLPCSEPRENEPIEPSSFEIRHLRGLCARGSLQGRLRCWKVSPRRTPHHSGIGLAHESLGRLARDRGGRRSSSASFLQREPGTISVRDTHRLTSGSRSRRR